MWTGICSISFTYSRTNQNIKSIWSLTGGGCLREVVVYGRWSFTRGGRLQEVVAYKRWSFTGGGRLREVVAYGRWSLTGGGHLPEMVAYQRSGLRGVYTSGNTHIMTGPFRHDDITVRHKSLQKVKFKVTSYLHLSCCLIHPGL